MGGDSPAIRLLAGASTPQEPPAEMAEDPALVYRFDEPGSSLPSLLGGDFDKDYIRYQGLFQGKGQAPWQRGDLPVSTAGALKRDAKIDPDQGLPKEIFVRLAPPRTASQKYVDFTRSIFDQPWKEAIVGTGFNAGGLEYPPKYYWNNFALGASFLDLEVTSFEIGPLKFAGSWDDVVIEVEEPIHAYGRFTKACDQMFGQDTTKRQLNLLAYDLPKPKTHPRITQYIELEVDGFRFGLGWKHFLGRPDFGDPRESQVVNAPIKRPTQFGREKEAELMKPKYRLAYLNDHFESAEGITLLFGWNSDSGPGAQTTFTKDYFGWEDKKIYDPNMDEYIETRWQRVFDLHTILAD